jgi:hypothetical protein
LNAGFTFEHDPGDRHEERIFGLSSQYKKSENPRSTEKPKGPLAPAQGYAELLSCASDQSLFSLLSFKFPSKALEFPNPLILISFIGKFAPKKILIG